VVWFLLRSAVGVTPLDLSIHPANHCNPRQPFSGPCRVLSRPDLALCRSFPSLVLLSGGKSNQRVGSGLVGGGGATIFPSQIISSYLTLGLPYRASSRKTLPSSARAHATALHCRRPCVEQVRAISQQRLPPPLPFVGRWLFR
jgi:hypothetical protein